MAARKLSPKQQRFVDEYCIDLNAAAAYRRAGYKVKNDRVASVEGHRLLANPSIAAAIAAAQAARSVRTQITADRVLQEIALLAFSDLGEVLDFSGDSVRLRPGAAIPEAARRAISSVKVKRYAEGHGDDAREVEVTEFKLWSKDAALAKLAQHLGMLKQQHEHSGPGGAPIGVQVYIPHNGRDQAPTGTAGAVPVVAR
jgi:phage terminase small subunit